MIRVRFTQRALHRFAAAAMSVALLQGVTVFGGILYLCRMDGRTHFSCCCRGGETTPSAECLRAGTGRCCELKVVKTVQPVAVRKDSWSRVSQRTGTVPARLVDLSDGSGTSVPPIPFLKGPPPVGPPILLKVSSYRI